MDKFAFDEWITCNYSKIKERLSLHGAVSEDGLQDAYLSCVSTKHKVSYDGYLALLLKYYRSSVKKDIAHGFMYIYPDPLFFEFLHEDEAQENMVQKKTHLSASRIMQYVKMHNSVNDIEMFTLYIFQGLPYNTIADYMGCSCTTVHKKIDFIKKNIQQYFSKVV